MPANEEVHIWCETFDLLKGDFFSVSINNFGSTNSKSLTSDQEGEEQDFWNI